MLKPSNKMLLKLLSKKKNEVKCDFCGYIGNSEKSLRLHQHKGHIQDNTPLAGTKRDFSQAQSKKPEISSLPPVKMKKMNAEKTEEMVENEYVQTPKKPSFSSRNNCDDCKEVFNTKESLDDHIKNGHKNVSVIFEEETPEQGPKPLKNLKQLPKELEKLSRFEVFFQICCPFRWSLLPQCNSSSYLVR